MLFPEGKPVLMADAESDISKRATYSTKHLWVTEYNPLSSTPRATTSTYTRVARACPSG